MHSKAESVASVTSQCSFSSTIVHVGDKKPPESGGQKSSQVIFIYLALNTIQIVSKQLYLDKWENNDH